MTPPIWKSWDFGPLEDHTRTEGRIEGVPRCPILKGQQRPPWFLTTYVRPGMILQVAYNLCLDLPFCVVKCGKQMLPKKPTNFGQK